MCSPTHHDQVIAKIQHFADAMRQCQLEKESLWLITPCEDCQRERVKESIFVYEEILKEYYSIFDDILQR